MDEDEGESKRFDPDSLQGKMVLKFLTLVQEYQLIYNLLLIINTKSDKDKDFIVNQQQEKIHKFGQSRLRSLELMNAVFALLHPSNGPLAAAQLLAENLPIPDGNHI